MNAVAVRTRRAAPADAAMLATLRYEFRAALDRPSERPESFLDRCTDWMADRLRGGTWLCWVAEAKQEITGAVWLELIEKLPNPVAELELHGYISSLYVRPAHRGVGVGSALLAAALQECDRRGVDAVVLWPTPRSRSLYQRHGFAAPAELLERRSRRAGSTH